MVVTLALPLFARQTLLSEQTTQIVDEKGELVRVVLDSDTDRQILFRWNAHPNGLEGEVGTVNLQRALYPGHSPRPLGLIAAVFPNGTNQISWVIESNGGTFRSDDDTALLLRLNGTALGHD